jgi:Mg/Co/Ni transporter MgtE
MTHEPITCHPEDDGLQVLESMAKHQVSHGPVVANNGSLLGMIAQADIATRIAETEHTPQVMAGILHSVVRDE